MTTPAPALHPFPDPSLKSFLFTLKDPHNVPVRECALKAEAKDEAIICRSDSGPHFCDFGDFDNCNANSNNFTYTFGTSCTDDTGLKRQTDGQQCRSEKDKS
jgi:hypothetical protein